MSYDFSKIKDDAITLPRDLAWSNWAKFDKVGDEVSGIIVDVFFRKAEGLFKDQRGITLKQGNGELINVGIKRIPFMLAKTDNLRLGDPLCVSFEKELPAKTKGYNPTKQYAFYGKNLEENKGNKTVAELEKEDIERQNGATAAEDDELEKTVAEAKTAADNLQG